jgi:hypothetical protein
MTQWGLDTLFNPAKRHMDEEKLRLQSTRAEVGDASGGKRIDLESGKVTIRKAKSTDTDTDTDADTDVDELAESETETETAADVADTAEDADTAERTEDSA